MSNCDILYLISKILLELKRFDEAIEKLSEIFERFNKEYGLSSDKIAKVYTEIGRAYQTRNDISNAKDYFRNSVECWNNYFDEHADLITDVQINDYYSLIFHLHQIYHSEKDFNEAFQISVEAEAKHPEWLSRNRDYQETLHRMKINCAEEVGDRERKIEELLKYETFLQSKNAGISSSHARTYLSLATVYCEEENYEKGIEFFKKAEHQFKIIGKSKIAKEIREKLNMLVSKDY